MDVISPEQRSALMSRIKGKDTKIELEVRRGLHALGFRFRLGGAGLPGRPDIVLPKYRTVIFVNGCFWHGHSCDLYRLPKTRTAFWKTKIESNRLRDVRVTKELRVMGWRVDVVRECSLRGCAIQEKANLITRIARKIGMRQP